MLSVQRLDPKTVALSSKSRKSHMSTGSKSCPLDEGLACHPIELGGNQSLHSKSCHSTDSQSTADSSVSHEAAADCELLSVTDGSDDPLCDPWQESFSDPTNSRREAAGNSKENDDYGLYMAYISSLTERFAGPAAFSKKIDSCTRSKPIDHEVSSSVNVEEKLYSSRPTVVRFGNVTVREFAPIPGDNPACSRGVPLTIGWEYNELPPLRVKFFERLRRHQQDHGPREPRDFILGRKERERILKHAGVSSAEIAKAIQLTNKARAQRCHTLRTMGTSKEMFGQVVQTAARRMKGLLHSKKNSSSSSSSNDDPSKIQFVKGYPGAGSGI